jgi:hypothetical protein
VGSFSPTPSSKNADSYDLCYIDQSISLTMFPESREGQLKLLSRLFDVMEDFDTFEPTVWANNLSPYFYPTTAQRSKDSSQARDAYHVWGASPLPLLQTQIV